MAAIFDFNGSGRLGRGKKFLPRGRSTVDKRERGGGRGVPEVIVILQNSVRSRTQFLIRAVKFQLSITKQLNVAFRHFALAGK